MRKSLLFVILCVSMVFAFSGCFNDTVSDVLQDCNATDTADDIKTLESMGFRREDIRVFDDHYQVEGDIRFEKADMRHYKAQTRQYHCGDLVYDLPLTGNNSFRITVKIDASLIDQSNWKDAILEAINAWNTEPVCGLYFEYITSGDADITFSKRYYAPLPDGSVPLGESSFPLNGKPGPTVYINADYIDNNLNYSKGTKTYVMMHELGHNIGLRHTDYMNRDNQGKYEGGTAIHIPGTPTNNSDRSSLMWSTHHSQSYPSNSFSNNDKIALRGIYPPFWVSYNRNENNARVYRLASRIPVSEVEWSNPGGKLNYSVHGDEVYVKSSPIGTHTLQAKANYASGAYTTVSTNIAFSPIQITAKLIVDGQPSGTLTKTLTSYTSYNLKDVFQNDFITGTGLPLKNLNFQGFYYENVALPADAEYFMSWRNESLEMRYSTDDKVFPLIVSLRAPDGVTHLAYDVEIYKNSVSQPVFRFGQAGDYIDITGEFTNDDTMILKFSATSSSPIIKNMIVSEMLTGYDLSPKYKILYEQDLDNVELFVEITLHAGPMMISCYKKDNEYTNYVMKVPEGICIGRVIGQGCPDRESLKGNDKVLKEHIRYYDDMLKKSITNSKHIKSSL